jgi:uncharacterized membrane protein
MKSKLKQELVLIAIVLIPFIYLAILWGDLPESVPLHWNIEGKIDRYGSKEGVFLITFLLPVLSYLMFTFAPSLDRKHKMDKMGGKYFRLKFSCVLFMSVLATYILYSVNKQSLASPSLLIGLVGFLFAILGNYFPVLPQNKFIGIRTSWTLKNETVWNETHRMAGKYWVIGGLSIVLSCLFLNPKICAIVMLGVTLIISVIPTAFAYNLHKKLTK